MRSVIYLLLLLSFGSIQASGLTIRFDRLTVNDGLLLNTIFNITQDKQGFLWFGTRDGLNRYDGYEFKQYRHDPKKPHSLSANWVTALHVDSQGQLWVGTANGLNRYDDSSDSFVHFQHNPTNPDSLISNAIRYIFEDSTGVLWIGTQDGLDQYQASTGLFVHFSHQDSLPASLADNEVKVIYEDSSGTVWVGTEGGLDKYNPLTGDFRHFVHQQQSLNSLSHNAVRSILEDSQGKLWIATKRGLNQFDRRTKRFVHFFHQSGDPHSLSQNDTTSLYEDKNGILWIGTDDGLNAYDRNTNQFTHYTHLASDPNSLGSNNINTLYADASGILWIGTKGGGVNKYDNKRDRFGHFNHQATNPNSISNNIVTSFVEDSLGVTWVGTFDGLNRDIDKQGNFQHYRHDKTNPHSLSDSNITALFEDSSATLWVGTKRGGLNKYDRFSGRFKRYQHDANDPNSLGEGRVWSILEDTAGTLWIGTQGGLNKFTPRTQHFEHFRHKITDPNSLSHDIVTKLFEDSNNTLWVGTRAGGLNKFDKKTKRFVHYKHRPNDPTSLGHNLVCTIFEDSRGTLWVGSFGGGLNKLDQQTGLFTQFREGDGLANDVVYGILEDNNSHLWLSTNQGISTFNLDNQTFKNYDVDDGLQSNEFNFAAFYKTKRSAMHFGGINGFNRFFASQISGNQTPWPIVITDFLLFNQPVPIARDDAKTQSDFTLSGAINGLESLQLGSQQNLMSFQFSALNYTNPLKVQYAYQLVGWDKDWVKTDHKNRRATYTNIPADDYVLRIKASSIDGQWQQQYKSLKIEILPPPWRTWWAYTFYSICMAALMLYIAHSQQKKIKAQQQKVLDQKQKVLDAQAINQQLKQVDRLKDEFLANTSHELRTPLNGIIGLTESLIDGVAGELPEQANQNLTMVVASGKRLANLVNDILDFSKLKNQNLTLNTRPLDLFTLTQVVLSLSQPLTGNKALKLVNAVPSDTSLLLADEDRVQQIMLNLIGNAIKFSDSGTVTVSVIELVQALEISITDTGIGIPADKFATIFDSFEQVQGDISRSHQGTGLGLAVSRQLVELHGGRLEVKSKVRQGSTFSFTLPVTHIKREEIPNTDCDQRVSRLYENLQPDPVIRHEIIEPTPDANNNDPLFRILLVDDEPINRQVLHNHLCLEQYQLFEAEDGEQALLAIDKHGPFDLILLDIMMPRMSGYEVCKKLRETWSVHELPVIFLTAKNQVADLVESFAVGGNDYLSKPVSKPELLMRVETHLQLLDINRNLEQKVSKRTLQLERATQAKSEFLAKMSHEIRTPMNAVIGLSRLTLKTALNDHQKDNIEKVVDASEALLGLINDILDFSKIEAGKLTIQSIPFDLDRLVRRAITLSAINAHAKGLELVTDIAGNIPQTIISDPLRLQQIIVNLVNNAVKFTESGLVNVQMDIKQDHADQLLLHCAVTDTGIGMNPDQMANLFKSFSQADETVTRKYGGTGLGLAISKQLSELMGGQIWLESKAGYGSTFHFTVMTDKVTEHTPATPLNEENATALKVLVVDDLAQVRTALLNMLANLGITAHQSADAISAISLIKSANADNAPFDLVLMDWHMPGLDGITAIKQLHQTQSMPGAMSLMVSTFDRDEAQKQLIGLPVTRLLEKPVNHQTIQTAINQTTAPEGQLPEQADVTPDKQIPNLSASHILLVEDNAINIQVALGYLQETGIKVDIAENGLIALQKIQQHSYDLVLMDIQMPEMDGITATGEIRNTLKNDTLVVIAMTAHAMPADIQKSLDAGMNEHINKPIDPDILCSTLVKYLATVDSPSTACLAQDGSQNDGSACIEQLSLIKGLEPKEAIAKMKGKSHFYLGLVKEFSKQQRSTEQSLLVLFDHQHWEELYLKVHSLKSNTAYIGAFELSKYFDQLENAYAQRDYDRPLLVNRCRELTILVNQISDIVKDAEEERPQLDFSIEQLQISLNQLLPLLKSSDFAAEEYLPDLAKLCEQSTYKQRIEHIAALVDDIEFEQAFDSTTQLLAELDT
jgi:signal transduction histidine kinase/ligand-binding sensor domain-containing protein/HPt (histidine-containing phosphotransfer) domain-containing protein/BarA-like signal transduction histidine kinase